ncbi:hypothetical protein K227x_22520 [Rubripirellula lacrimiformis]|uniref:Uncharacterized protein n=1 Tax=Rubripirellula lacrimiformis TaxID=1930273 RepID=A0A517N9Q6_9BACT|nr:hypothetical protein K227x_22520 [Rubripirellula lacrimiformis]
MRTFVREVHSLGRSQRLARPSLYVEVCPHLVLISYELFIWYDDSLLEMTGTKHTRLIRQWMAPDKITPILGVLQRRTGGKLLGNG